MKIYRWRIFQYLIVKLFLKCTDLVITRDNTFTRDFNTDLTNDFKSNNLISTGYTYKQDCFTSCLIQCLQMVNCMSATYSTANNICSLFSKPFCYGTDTRSLANINLFRKVVDYGKQQFI
jgi:hypothetical protein